MKIAVKDLHPNPFRDMKRYPIDEEKVSALKASIKSTGFWDNIVVRRNPDGDGYQIAYGHHRIKALKALHIEFADLPVRNLTDETMLRMLANENMEEWGAKASVMQETIRAVVGAYAEGAISLAAPTKKTSDNKIRFAPSFIQGSDGRDRDHDHPYTAESIAKFLEWDTTKVKTLLGYLELEEEKYVRPDSSKGMTLSAVQAVVKSANQYKAHPEAAKAVAAGLTEKIKNNEIVATHAANRRQEVREAAAEIAAEFGVKTDTEKRKARKRMPDQNEAAHNTADAVLDFAPPLFARVEKLAEFKEHLNARSIARLVSACRKHAATWEKLADQLEG